MSSHLDRILNRTAQLAGEIDSLQEAGRADQAQAAERVWQPRFELYHHQERLFIDLEVPGVPAAALRVEPHPDLVIVRGHKPNLSDLPAREQIVSSREFGPFTSQFAIPAGYALEELDQRLENGVLHLKIRISPRGRAQDAR